MASGSSFSVRKEVPTNSTVTQPAEEGPHLPVLVSMEPNCNEKPQAAEKRRAANKFEYGKQHERAWDRDELNWRCLGFLHYFESLVP
jgi:hypothetical protein